MLQGQCDRRGLLAPTQGQLKCLVGTQPAQEADPPRINRVGGRLRIPKLVSNGRLYLQLERAALVTSLLLPDQPVVQCTVFLLEDATGQRIPEDDRLLMPGL